MNWLQFISSLVNSLAWPSALIIVIAILRRPLSKLIASLQHLSYKGITANFEAEVATLSATVEASKAANGEEKTTQPELDSVGIPIEVAALAASNPTAGVLMAWREIERSADDAMKRLGFGKGNEIAPFRQLYLLSKNGYLDQETVRLIGSLRQLRNKVAHHIEPAPMLTIDDAWEYAKLAQLVSGRIDALELKK